MTFREKFEKECGTVFWSGCPHDHGYEERPSFYTHCASTTCEACWSREMKEKENKPMKYHNNDTVLVQGRIYIVNFRDNAYCVEFNNGKTAWYQEDEIFELPKPDKTYEQGLEDAWELARKLFAHTNLADMQKMFGSSDEGVIIMSFDVQEALAKFKAYEESQENNVGDVVTNHNLGRCIVLEKRNDGLLSVLTESGEVRIRRQDELHKTGKHIEIESLLEQIKGDANE